MTREVHLNIGFRKNLSIREDERSCQVITLLIKIKRNGFLALILSRHCLYPSLTERRSRRGRCPAAWRSASRCWCPPSSPTTTCSASWGCSGQTLSTSSRNATTGRAAPTAQSLPLLLRPRALPTSRDEIQFCSETRICKSHDDYQIPIINCYLQ